MFYVWYNELCRRQNSNPICAVRNPNQRNDQVLEFNADRIKIEDWHPIINAIRLDTSLHVISIHSKMPNQKFIEEADTEEKVNFPNNIKIQQHKFEVPFVLNKIDLF